MDLVVSPPSHRTDFLYSFWRAIKHWILLRIRSAVNSRQKVPTQAFVFAARCEAPQAIPRSRPAITFNCLHSWTRYQLRYFSLEFQTLFSYVHPLTLYICLYVQIVRTKNSLVRTSCTCKIGLFVQLYVQATARGKTVGVRMDRPDSQEFQAGV